MTTTALVREVPPAEALDALRRRILVDGFEVVLDLQAAHGSHLHDAVSGQDFLDFYAFFASQPVSYNHPRLREPEFQARLLTAATTKVANSDIYTQAYATFVQTLDEVAGLPDFEHFFFIDGGGLAIENALKAAFDWKVRKNIAAGRGELGTRVLHFKKCFHGRTGYTMSLTDSPDPRKTMYYPKFDWPRVSHPSINFALPEPQRSEDVAQREAQTLAEIDAAYERLGHDIAAIIIETIQGEGGDNHVRPEFLRKLREVADQRESILIFDEVQCGVGITGRMWACENHGVMPDVIAFGKKMQICGIMANKRFDEVDNVFKVSSRINSTWGGNIADMVRSTQFLRIIGEENLLENAAARGEELRAGLEGLAGRHPQLTAVRGQGLMCAFDLPDTESRNRVQRACWDRRMICLPSGTKSIRFRPVLDVSSDDIERGLVILDEALAAVFAEGQ